MNVQPKMKRATRNDTVKYLTTVATFHEARLASCSVDAAEAIDAEGPFCHQVTLNYPRHLTVAFPQRQLTVYICS